ncbi:MAG: DUF2723 domain-containing protein, partial [Bdellovibrionales bacterium]|nr:DUF2723 domain-containing protein [Bdellovibrionales bacterium]
GVNAGVWICTLLICAVACATYFPRVALTVQPGDGAELAAAAYNGAIVHPPGYPLYSMCARALVSFFPSNPYYTLSLFSAVLQALTVSLFFQVCFVISSSVFIAGVFASLWMCYGPVVRTATDVEVFALHHFLVTSFTLLMLLYWPSKKRSMLCLLLLGTLGGLASANHHTTILWSPLVLVFLLKNRRHLTRELSLIGIGFGAGLSTYLYLLLPRSSEQLVAFPGITNLRDLWLWIIRDGYGTFSLWSGDGSPTVSYMSHFFITSFSSHWLAWIGVLLLLLGTLRSPSALKLGLGGTTVLHLVFLARIIFPANDPLFEDTAARFYGVITLSMYLSAALAFRSFIAGSRELSCVIALFAFVLALQAIPQELAEGTASRDFILQAELDSILEEVPEQAVFISSTDRISMGIQYQQIVEARRPDVLLLVSGLLGSYAYRE